MLAKIKEITREGLVLRYHNNNQIEEEFWLPAQEWSDNAGDFQTAISVLELGELHGVVELSPEQKISGRKVVSAKMHTRAHVDKSWIGELLIIQVQDISRTIIRGRIGNVPAFAKLKSYDDWYESKIGEILRDHAAIGKGDYLGGVVINIDSHPNGVELDLGAYILERGRQFNDRWRQSREKAGLSTQIQAPAVVEMSLPELSIDVVNAISPVLIVEDHPEDRNLIEDFLRRQNIKTVASGNLEEISSFPLESFRLAIVDINLDQEGVANDGFKVIESLQTTENVRVLLVTGEHISREKLNRWGHLRVHACLAKPLGRERLQEAIQEALATPSEPWSTWVEPSQPYGQMVIDPLENGSVPNAHIMSVEEAVQSLASECKRATIHVFRIHPRSLRARSIAFAGPQCLRWERFRGKVGKSPIKDTAFSNQECILANHVPATGRHLWTRKMMTYESFLGFPVHGPEPFGYALVVFHPELNAFDQAFQASARLCAERVSHALERKHLRDTRENEATDASTGMAIQVLAHEFRNEIDPLRERTRKLREMMAADGSPKNRQESGLRFTAELFDWFKSAEDKIAALSGVRMSKRSVILQDCIREAARACRNMIHEHESFDGPCRHIFIEDAASLTEQWTIRTARATPIIVFFNLFLNAAQQIALMTTLRKTGLIWYSCERRFEASGRPVAVVRIHDTGPGIHPDDWERVFEPGFTTKPNGTGLGLGICRRLLKGISESGVTANLQITRSVLWDGTTFSVTIPLAD